MSNMHESDRNPSSDSDPTQPYDPWAPPTAAPTEATPTDPAPAHAAPTSAALGDPVPAGAPTTFTPAAEEASPSFMPTFAPAPVEPVGPVQAGPSGAGSGRGGSGGARTILTAAVLSAVLASGGTVAILDATGSLNRAAGAAGGADQTATHQSVTLDENSAIIDVASKASPAVVQITATGQATDPQGGGTIPESGVGSGIIFDPAGWILTNRHVVRTSTGQTASQLTVELKDGRQFTGTVYGIDTLTDLAIVRIDATGLPTAPLGSSSDLKVGELAIAIGSPLGTYTNSVTSGIVSATGRSVVVEANTRLNDLIQTDAAINPGNSGGPLLDAAGNVIGINTAVAQGSSGIGFAIPIDIAKPIMSQALAGEQLTRPYIGIRYEEINVQVQAEKHLSVDHGALIGASTDTSGASQPAVTAGSPADKAGLKDGDVIVGIEDQTIDQEHPLDATLAGYAPGQTIHLHVIRDGKDLTIAVTLGTRPSGL
jgi:serine protease Do